MVANIGDRPAMAKCFGVGHRQVPGRPVIRAHTAPVVVVEEESGALDWGEHHFAIGRGSSIGDDGGRLLRLDDLRFNFLPHTLDQRSVEGRLAIGVITRHGMHCMAFGMHYAA